MANPYVGQITAYGFAFAPKAWAYCDGSNVPLNQYPALYALIGNTFGGSGYTQFGLPNLSGASPCGTGAGPGLTQRNLGQAFGTASVTLDQTTMPAHSHTPQAAPFSRTSPAVGTPTALSALTTSSGGDLYSDGPVGVTMAAGAVSPMGGGAAHNNMQPYLALNYCIALLGIYPEFG